jgi:hypothetical protein
LGVSRIQGDTIPGRLLFADTFAASSSMIAAVIKELWGYER